MIYNWKQSWRTSIVLFWFTNTARITSVMFGLALLSRNLVPTWLRCWKSILKIPLLPMCDDRHFKPSLRHWEIFWWDCKLFQGKEIYIHGIHVPLPPHSLPLSCVLGFWRIAPGHRCWGCGCCFYEHNTLPWVPFSDNELRRWRYNWKRNVYYFVISWNDVTLTCLVYPEHLSLPTSMMAYRKLWRDQKVWFWSCRYVKGSGLDGRGLCWNY